MASRRPQPDTARVSEPVHPPGRSYVGEPDQIVAELQKDEAVRDADTLLVTIPNQLGVDYNAHLI